MNRSYAVFAVVFAVSMLIGIKAVEVVNSNPLPPAWMNPKMSITIQSPVNGAEQTLPLLVSFTAEGSHHFVLSSNQTEDWNKAFFYTIDNENMATSAHRFTEVQGPTDKTSIATDTRFSGQAYISNLTDGTHRIIVYWGVEVNVGTPLKQIVYNSSWSATSQFYVGSSTAHPLIEPDFLVIVIPLVFIIAIIAVTSVSLVYFRRRKGKP
jgi:hypothetical protein